MRRMLVLLAIMTMWPATGTHRRPPAAPPPSAAVTSGPTDERGAVPAPPPFVNRAWVRPGDMYPPGAITIFLGDGTLLSDSCFETYRLSRWRSDGEDRVIWQEDGIDIHANVVRADENELLLELQLSGGSEQHRFVAATVPYVCPDMPR